MSGSAQTEDTAGSTPDAPTGDDAGVETDGEDSADKAESSCLEVVPLPCTPYDIVWRTLEQDSPHLLIPLINSVFRRTYSANAKVQLEPTEVIPTNRKGMRSRRAMDAHFNVIEVGAAGDGDRFHMEEESGDGTRDGEKIDERIWRYVQPITQIGRVGEDDRLNPRFPKSAVLFLRGGKKMAGCNAD